MALADMVIPGRGPFGALQGFESVGRAARLVIADGIEDAIERVQAMWLIADELLEDYGMDAGVREADVESIETVNVFQGPHKSLAASPITRFPNVSVTAYATRPSALDARQDHMDVAELSLLVEVMVKAGPIEDDPLFIESLVHRRIERTSEAVLMVLRESGTLLGTVDRVGQPRGGIVNQSWTRNEAREGETGKTYVLHGSRFTYALTRRISTT